MQTDVSIKVGMLFSSWVGVEFYRFLMSAIKLLFLNQYATNLCFSRSMRKYLLCAIDSQLNFVFMTNTGPKSFRNILKLEKFETLYFTSHLDARYFW